MQIASSFRMPVYICYVCESGTRDDTGTTSHFVLAGIAIPAVQRKELDERISRIKRKFALDDAEIDTVWMMRRYAEQEKLPGFSGLDYDCRRQEVQKERNYCLRLAAATKPRGSLHEITKAYKKTESYIHLTQDERKEFLREICDGINTWTDARIFAEVCDKRALAACARDAPRMYEDAFTQVLSRFQAFLVNRGNYLGTPLHGLIVQGNDAAVAVKITKVMRNHHRKGTIWTKFDKIVESPLLVDVRLTSMAQIADVCGYAIQRFFECGESDLFDRIYTKFDRAKDTVVGIRHYTAQKVCRCRVCVDHSLPHERKWSRSADCHPI